MKINENNFKIKKIENMPKFEDTLSRMKSLYNYGTEVNESKNANVHTLEFHALAADGVNYGIIRECNKYYIKSAPKGKETIAESYDYLGGFRNRKDYEYTSYANAKKHFDLKMASICEACDAKVNSDLNAFSPKTVLMTEGTKAMQQEIARQRQIMYNASMIMNEANEIGASRKNDVVKFDGKNPEAETGKKGDEGSKKTTANPDYAGSKTDGVKKNVAPFNNKTTSTPDQLKEDCDCDGGSCTCGKEDWASKGIGKGRDPKKIGWDIDGQSQVNEEEEDWASKGLPSSAGVGDADTSHNNAPFNKGLNEGESCPNCGNNPCTCENNDEDDYANEDYDDDMNINDVDSDDEDFSEDDIDDSDLDAEDDDIDMGMDDEDDLDSELDADDEDLEDDDFEDEDMDDEDFEDDDYDDDFEDEDMDDEDFEDDDMADDDFEDDDMADDDFEDDDYDDDFEDEDMDDDDFEDEDMDDEDFEDDDMDDEELDECGEAMPQQMPSQPMQESKSRRMNKIVESVVRSLMKEDELHDFGKHPGYRKKPMELPSTGEDKNRWGEDWNDESVHSEEPFGQQIGNGMPFNQMVNSITNDVMAKIAAKKSGIPVVGGNKKKAE